MFTTGDLLRAAEGAPWLATGLLALAAVGYALEKITGLTGPLTKLSRWWYGRELRKLRRAAVLRAERRRIEQEEESARIAALRAEVKWLRGEVTRLRAEVHCTCDHTQAARNTPRVPVPRR